MRSLIKKFGCVIISVFVLNFLMVQYGFGQSKNGNTPYPIIFIHGLISDNTTWGTVDGKMDDILDYLNGAGLKRGSNLNISLNSNLSKTGFNNRKEDDVVLHNPNPGRGDYYTINFACNTDGGTAGKASGVLTFGVVEFSFDHVLFVDNPDNYKVNDILRIDNEYMQVTSVNPFLNSVTVERSKLGSGLDSHKIYSTIWNISNESNQESIAKQGWGLKLAIDAIINANPGVKKVILVGHSMGGLAAREYIRTYSNNKVAKLITIGTPHLGSTATDWTKYLNTLNTYFAGIDDRSNASRDLSYNYGGASGNPMPPYNSSDKMDNGVYLFGGANELNLASETNFYSYDVNADGTLDKTTGLNEDLLATLPSSIAYSWIVSQLPGNIIDGDIAVRRYRQFPWETLGIDNKPQIAIGDTLMTDRNHLAETSDYYSLLRGLDEPASAELAYQIDPNSTTRGFITYGTNYNSEDIDLFKVIITENSQIDVSILASSSTGIEYFNLLDANQKLIEGTANIHSSIASVIPPGIYYIQIAGSTSEHPDSYRYPYTLTLSTTAISSTLKTLPDKSFNYYDLLTNQGYDKVIKVTNVGTSDLTISKITLTGTDAHEFSITGPLNFIISGGKSQNVIVRFSPTTIGQKKATLVITNNSADIPIKSIALSGNGTDHPTRTLITTPDIKYNFADQPIAVNSNKTFQLQNTGSDNITISDITLNGENASDFSISKPAIPYDVASNGGISNFTVTFNPSSIGSKTAILIVADNSDNQPRGDTILLYGNGTNDINTGITGTLVAYEYWFDDNYSTKVINQVPLQNLSNLTAGLRTTGLNTGPHTLNIRYLDGNRQWSTVISKAFVKPRNIVAYEYWFDDNYTAKVNVAVNPTPTLVVDSSIDTKQLPGGKHTYNIRYKDDDGQWSNVSGRTFYKASFITAYRYWFDTDDKHMATVSVSPPVSPFTLSTNLNTSTLAAGSHTIHFQFKDSNGAWSSATNDTTYRSADTIPTITSFTPVAGKTGTTVTITGTNFTKVTTVSFGGITASSFTLLSPTRIAAVVGAGASGDVSVATLSATARHSGFTFVFSLPANNFSISATSATCKGVADGVISITAAQSLNYTATVSGSSTSYTFTTTQAIPNLAAGTYHVCITVEGHTDYQQCYDLVITEPKDLSVYSTVNADNTLNLSLNGGNVYNINLNGKLYTMSENSITLPLKYGDNQLSITTDKLCQGTFQKVINILREIVPFPDPFSSTLSINLGNDVINKAYLEVHNVAGGKVVYSKQFFNQSGVVELDLNGLKEGAYALHIILDNTERVFKIIKK